MFCGHWRQSKRAELQYLPAGHSHDVALGPGEVVPGLGEGEGEWEGEPIAKHGLLHVRNTSSAWPQLLGDEI